MKPTISEPRKMRVRLIQSFHFLNLTWSILSGFKKIKKNCITKLTPKWTLMPEKNSFVAFTPSLAPSIPCIH